MQALSENDAVQKRERQRVYRKAYNEKNKEHIREQTKEYRKKYRTVNAGKAKKYREANREKKRQHDRDPINRRAKNLRDWLKKYKITQFEYDSMYEIQKGCCAICNTPFSSRSRKENAQVDHCHATDKIRGLLCFRCNLALGGFRDSPALLERAIKYLRGDIW